MHVQIKSEKADSYSAGGYVFPPPQVQPQQPSALSNIPGQCLNMTSRSAASKPTSMPNINTAIQSAPENKDTCKIFEDQVDFSSIKGIFGWTCIDNIHVPCIFRHKQKYVSVRIVEHKLLSRYPNSYPEELGKQAPLTSFFVTQNEALLLNEINTVHCDGEFGLKQFTTKDLIVLLPDFEVFYGLVKKTFPENKTVVVDQSHPNQQQQSGIKDDLSKLSNYCGWFQINNTVSPYIRRMDDKYIPLSVIRYAAGLLIDIQVSGVLLSVAECELLNKTCKVAGFDFCFSNTTSVIALSEVTRRCTVHIRDLPFESPLTHAHYIDLPSPAMEQRPTPPLAQSYPNQGGIFQNTAPQIHNTWMQMQGQRQSNDKNPNYEGFSQRSNPTMYNQRMFMYNPTPWIHNNTVSPPNVALNPQTNIQAPNMSCGPVSGQFRVQNMNKVQMKHQNTLTNCQKNSLQRNTGSNNILINNSQNGWQGGQHRYQSPISRLDNMNQSLCKLPISNSNQTYSSVASSSMLNASIQNQRHNQFSVRKSENCLQSFPASETLSTAAEQHHGTSKPVVALETLSAAAEQHHGTSKPAVASETLSAAAEQHHGTSKPVAASETLSAAAEQHHGISKPIHQPVPNRRCTDPPPYSFNRNPNTFNIMSGSAVHMPVSNVQIPVLSSVQQAPPSHVPSPGAQTSMDVSTSPEAVVTSVTMSRTPPVVIGCDSGTSKLQTSKHSVAVQQLKDAIVGVWLGGKSISCLCLELPNRSGQFCLVEAVCKLYYSGSSVEEFQYALSSVLNISLVTCTEDEEKAFILYYSLPVKELKCNKMIGFEELKIYFPQLSYMFKDKKSTDAQDKKISDTDQVGENEMAIGQSVLVENEQKSNRENFGKKRPCPDTAVNIPPAKQANRSLEEMVQKLKNQHVPNTDFPSTGTLPEPHDDIIVLD